MVESKAKTTKSETIQKSQKVKVMISVYRVNDKIVSVLGIPATDAVVTHKFPKSKLKPEELYAIAATIKNSPDKSKNPAYKAVIDQALNEKTTEVILPPTLVTRLEAIGNCSHEILNIEIELLS